MSSCADPPTATAPVPDACVPGGFLPSPKVSAACSTAPRMTATPKATHNPRDGCVVTRAVTTPLAAATMTEIPAATARHTTPTPFMHGPALDMMPSNKPISPPAKGSKDRPITTIDMSRRRSGFGSGTWRGTPGDAGCPDVVPVKGWPRARSAAVTNTTAPSPLDAGSGVNTRDFRCLWCSGVLPLWCSVPVFESGFVVPPLKYGHGFGPRVAAGMARGSTVRGPGGRGGFSS